MATTTGDYPTIESVTEGALRFFRQHLVKNGVPVSSAQAATQKGGDRWATVSAFATPLAVVLANCRLKEDATSPDTAIGDDLDALCAVYGLTRSAGAGASGNVVVTCTGVVTYAAGQELVAASNGKRYRVVAVATVPTGSNVGVIGIDTGTETNLAQGEILTWTQPPTGSATTCVVASGGLTNGQPADTNSRLRKRLLKRLREPQNGGSWAHYQRWIEDTSSSVENAYVYPAAQGPGTVHAAYTVEGTRDNDYQRAGTSALTTSIADAVVLQAPEFADTTITTVDHEDLSVVLKLTLPNPVVQGGAGGGWIDKSTVRWPPALGSGAVTVSSVTDSDSFVVTSTTVPVDGAWIHIFDSTNREVLLARVVSHSGSSGSYTINLDRALSGVTAGDHVFPASERGGKYADTFMAEVAKLAPGEKTTEVDVLPRAYRHPRAIDGFPSGLTTRQLTAVQTSYGEIQNASYFALNGSTGYTLPLEPSVPGAVTSAPNIWRVKHFAVYPA